MQVPLEVARSYDGSIAGPAFVWLVAGSLVALSLTLGSILRSRPRATRASITSLLVAWCLMWGIHIFVAYYTQLQVTTWELINSVHVPESQRTLQSMILHKECGKMLAISTWVLTACTILSIHGSCRREIALQREQERPKPSPESGSTSCGKGP